MPYSRGGCIRTISVQRYDTSDSVVEFRWSGLSGLAIGPYAAHVRVEQCNVLHSPQAKLKWASKQLHREDTRVFEPAL